MVLGIQPSEVWSLTFPEFFAACEAWQRFNSPPVANPMALQPDELDPLLDDMKARGLI